MDCPKNSLDSLLTFADCRPMFGRHFESMYTGSMIGAGSVAFALMGYVISHMRPPAFDVELNPKLLAFILGDPEDEIEKAIEFLCSPDLKSRSKAEEGRRLVRRNEYLYHVVNGETYNAIRNDADKKAYWRDQKKRQRMAAREKAPPEDEKTSDSQPANNSKFVKPTAEEMELHAFKIGLPDSELEKFINHFESNGWKVGGKAAMKSWTHAMANWKARWQENNKPAQPKFTPPNPHNEQINVPRL